jgi:hypothetical protein
MLGHLQLDLCSILLSHSFSRGRNSLVEIRKLTQAAQNPKKFERKCYACGEKGHFANQCPNPRTHPQTAAPTPAPTCGANSIPVTAKLNYARGTINNVAIEEAQESPDVVIGTFFINDTSGVVLFDFRASHSFISTAYVEKHNLPQPC